MKFNCTNHRKGKSGVALVTVLIILTILTVLVVGLTVTARYERVISSGYTRDESVNLIALSAVNHARALLASNIPEVGPNAPSTATQWWVAPGQLWTQTGGIGAPPAAAIKLYTGDSNLNTDPDLNRKKIDGTYPINPSGSPMKVAWVTIGKDPSQPVSAINPMVARFAYWIDAENTRVNLQTARTWDGQTRTQIAPTTKSSFTPATLAASYPGYPNGNYPIAPGNAFCSDLGVLVTSAGQSLSAINNSLLWSQPVDLTDVKQFETYFLTNGAFTGSKSSWNTFYNSNQFDLTVWGESSQFTPFGTDRLIGVVNRNQGIPGNEFYWDLNNPNQMIGTSHMVISGSNVPGGASGQYNESDYYFHAAQALATAFLRKDWPGHSGTSLASKWATRAGLASPASDQQVAEQVAWNLLTINGFLLSGGDVSSDVGGLSQDGRWAAGTSSQPVTTSDLFPTVVTLPPNPTGNRYLPQNGNPYLTEFGLGLDGSVTGSLSLSLVAELFLPQYSNIPDSSNSDTERGISLGGVYAMPTTVSFQILTSSLNMSSWTPQSGWMPTSTGSFTTFIYSPTLTGSAPLNPLASGSLAATGSTLPITLLPNNFTVLSSNFTGSGQSRLTIPLAPSATSVSLTNLSMKIIAVNYPASNTYRIFQYCPLMDSSLSASQPPFLFLSGQSSTISFGASVLSTAVNGAANSNSPQTYTVEVDDPRHSALSDHWTPCNLTATTTYPGLNTLGASNSKASGWPQSPQNLPDIAVPFSVGGNNLYANDGYLNGAAGNPGSASFELFSPGRYQALWTAPPYIIPATGDYYLDLTAADASSSPPDYLALELVGSPMNMNLGSYTSTVNVNSRIYPLSWGLGYRTKALTALFSRWTVGSTNVNASALASNIGLGMPSTGWEYVGDTIPLLQAAGDTATKWQKQALFSTLAGRLTTQCSTFGVWGVAQAVQQTSSGAIVVNGEKRFYAVIRIRAYPGIDGLYGNAKSDNTGKFVETLYGGGGFTAMANASGAFPPFGLMRDSIDGPDLATPAKAGANSTDPVVPFPAPITYTAPTSLRGSYNPLKPYLDYEIAHFEYLDP